jgi:hypothetical protein
VHCSVAFSLEKGVMGWRYFADVASMSFSEKNHIATCDMVILGYGVKKSYGELRYNFVFCLTR